MIDPVIAAVWEKERHELALRHCLVKAFDEVTRPTIKPKRERKDCYPYIPLSSDLFLAGIDAANSYLPEKRRYPVGWWRSYEGRPKFLDVGCGGGAKMLLAQAFGFQVTGIEIERAYIQHAKQLKLDVLQADGRKWMGYDQFDLIYAYRPHSDAGEETRLERHIINQMQPGALFLLYLGNHGAKYKGATELSLGDLPRHSDPQLWRKD